jgi:hypothetical protein
MNSYSNSNSNSCAKRVNQNHTLHDKYYSSMDLCSQAQMCEESDNILNRMDKLRSFAREQQAKRMKSQRQQTSFCF